MFYRFFKSVSVDSNVSNVDVSADAWKAYFGLNCTIHTKHQHQH